MRIRVLVSLTALWLIPSCRGSEPQSAPSRPSVRDPSVLIVVHSFSGHTATVGREIADMLGGAFFRAADPPPVPDVTGPGPLARDVLPTIRMDGVRRLFVGFPIYDEKPSATAHEIVRTLALNGVRVTPFFTFVHYADPAALEAFAREIAEHGGEPTPPMGFLLPALASNEDIVARARASLLQRRDLWSLENEPPPTVHCEDAGPPHDARLCDVPGGVVWLGDVSPTTSAIPGLPPRLEHVQPFDLDEKEISIAQYRRCVAAHRCREHPPQGASVDLARGGEGDLPMPDLSWTDAADYCAFVGLRLPTEAEWVRAARGSSLDAYPWGNEPPGSSPARANLGEKPANGLPHYAFADPDSSWVGDGYAGLAPGCRFPLGRSRFGHCDLIGNLLEWVDAPVPTAKGGSWIDVEPRFVTAAARATFDQRNLGSYLTGARCARSRPGRKFP